MNQSSLNRKQQRSKMIFSIQAVLTSRLSSGKYLITLDSVVQLQMLPHNWHNSRATRPPADMSQQKHKTDNTSIVQRRRQSLTVNHHPRNDQRTIRSHTSGQSEPGRKMLKADVTRLKKCSKLTSRPSVGGGKGKDGREDVVRPKEHSQLTSRTQTQNRVATPTAKGFLIQKSGHHKPSRQVVDFRGAGKKKVMHATHTIHLD